MRGILLGLLLCAAAAWTSAAPCDGFGSCDACLAADVQCGWCVAAANGTSACVLGGPTGPTNSTPAACAQWMYDRCEPPSPCFRTALDSCAACATNGSDAGCGWCGAAVPSGGAACMPGAAQGPLSGVACADWVIGGASAGLCDRPCGAIAGCANCTADPRCGWCDDGVCLAGAAAGPSFAACNASSWRFGGGAQCPAPEPTCAEQPTCDLCLSARNRTAGALDCAFCLDLDDFGCRDADARGQCQQWRADSCEDPCSAFPSCAVCALALSQDNLDCGWCSSTGSGACWSGDANGPFNQSVCNASAVGSGAWWFGGACPTECGLALTCSECSARADCGWCQSTQICLNVTQADDRCVSSQFFWGGCPVPRNCSEFSDCLDCTDYSCWYCSSTCVDQPGDELSGDCVGPSDSCVNYVFQNPLYVGVSKDDGVTPATVAILVILAMLLFLMVLAALMLIYPWAVTMRQRQRMQDPVAALNLSSRRDDGNLID